MNHYELKDELRTKLLESADWSTIGLTLTEAKKVVAAKDEPKDKEEVKTEPVEEEVVEDEVELDQLIEQALHTCPLCLGQLDEALEEDRILEHLDVAAEIIERVSQLNESDEDIEDKLSDCLSSMFLQTIDFGDEDEEEDEITSKK